MILEIKFDKQIFKKLAEIQFYSIWKKNVNNKRLIWIILFFIIGVFLAIDENIVGYLFVFISIHYLIKYIEYYHFYQKNKRIYFLETDKHIHMYEESNQNIILEFHHDYFKYSDFKFKQEIKWFAFKGYRIIEDTLFLDLNHQKTISYNLNKNEVTEEEWKKVIQIVDEKVVLY
ncbi:hypothetical protein [Tenacibaculum sp. M341]|uniref:hypothetical protein n=1 Tax=Tenacibaculum sp. M341 TaxID=2530339 RepID=UPI001053FE2B|nr:hypothetical protein [Tenacibaculum sp. M341]TCI84831.1 hypothetical protein EYW44_19610 [Tenacibaculum sp. M341]